jgi:hypothetical protein
MHVQRVLPLQSLAKHFHQVVGAGDGIDTLAAAPDVLVCIDLHEQAGSLADVAALDAGDLELGGRRRFRRCRGDSLFQTRAERREPTHPKKRGRDALADKVATGVCVLHVEGIRLI